MQDAVSEGVRLGYSVIEDQIRQAQTLAKKLSPGGNDFSGGDNEIRPLLSRMLRTYGDLTSVWIEVLNAAMGNIDVMNLVMGKGNADRTETVKSEPNGKDPSSTEATGIGTISFNIIANCPVETKFDLFATSIGLTSIVVQDLRSRESDKPPLDDVAVLPAGPGSPIGLVVKIPSGQPTGLYQGLIVDSLTDAPVGALSVTVLSP